MTTTGAILNLASLLQPYPMDGYSAATPVNLENLGEIIVNRQLSPHTGISTDAIPAPRFPNAGAMFTPVNGVEAAHEAIFRWRVDDGIIRLTPDDETLAVYEGVAEDIGLHRGFRLPMDQLLSQDRRKTLVVSSPNGISGRIGMLQEMVRLIRHFSLVVIDERLVAFSLRRLTPLTLEWQNVISIQRFPFIMPGQTQPFAWMIHPSALRDEIGAYTDVLTPATQREVTAYGGIETFRAERQVTRARSQLYREMRKLSVLSVPYPSWSNALLARIERGDRDDIVSRLHARGIEVYAPPHANLLQHIRVTAINPEATARLKEALIAINLEI